MIRWPRVEPFNPAVGSLSSSTLGECGPSLEQDPHECTTCTVRPPAGGPRPPASRPFVPPLAHDNADPEGASRMLPVAQGPHADHGRPMRTIAPPMILVATLAMACGGKPATTETTPEAAAATDSSAPPSEAAPADMAFKDMNREQRMDYMKNTVLPTMKMTFQEF